LKSANFEYRFKCLGQSICPRRGVRRDQDQINQILSSGACQSLAIGARVGMDLFCDVLFQRERGHLKRRYVGKLKQVRARQDLGLTHKNLGHSNVDKHFVEESARELSSRSITNCVAGLVAELSNSFEGDLEEVVSFQSLSIDQSLLRGLNALAMNEVNVFGRSRDISEAEIERKSALHHPLVGSVRQDSSKKTIEDNGFTQANKGDSGLLGSVPEPLFECRSER
jgi:hypothetical protein